MSRITVLLCHLVKDDVLFMAKREIASVVSVVSCADPSLHDALSRLGYSDIAGIVVTMFGEVSVVFVWTWYPTEVS